MGQGGSSGSSPGGSQKELQVTTNSLRSVAKIWDQESAEIGKISGIASGIHLNHITAGVFQLIVSPYESLLNAITDRSNEGKTEMGKIASELNNSADTYERAESENTRLAQQAGKH